MPFMVKVEAREIVALVLVVVEIIFSSAGEINERTEKN